jgi:PEP-CTERM motif
MSRFRKFLVLFSFVCIFLSGHAWAISLSFSPSTSEIGIGDSIDIDLIISGMENDDLGYFEFDVNYDDSIIGFNSYTLGMGLGDDLTPWTGNAEDWSLGDLGSGTINLIELSYLLDLSFQADFFTLATLSFTGLNEGISLLSYSNLVLSDDWGVALSASLEGGSVDVSAPIPEPATLLLFGTGLASFLGFRRKYKK